MLEAQAIVAELASGKAMAKDPTNQDSIEKSSIHGLNAHYFRIVLDLLDDTVKEDSEHRLLPLELVAVQV